MMINRKRLKHALVDLDLTAYQAAARAKLPPSELSRMLHGHRTPTQDLLRRLEKALHLPQGALVEAEEQTPKL